MVSKIKNRLSLMWSDIRQFQNLELYFILLVILIMFFMDIFGEPSQSALTEILLAAIAILICGQIKSRHAENKKSSQINSLSQKIMIYTMKTEVLKRILKEESQTSISLLSCSQAKKKFPFWGLVQLENGGGFVGVHSATDTEYDWPWYGNLVDAYFDGHPAIQAANVQRQDATHRSTIGLPDVWTRTDEWYNFRDGPGPNSTILLTVDESSYTGGTMGAVHPIAWNHTVGNGRSWYTAMGHTSETYQEPLFLSHLLGGVQWAAGMDLNLNEMGYLPIVLK